MQHKEPQNKWTERFVDIVRAYYKNRAPDPFMNWFRTRDAERLLANDFERILTILIDARFDQRTTAEKALQNTITVLSLIHI